MSDALFISSDDLKSGELNTSLFRIAIPGKYLKLAGHTIRYQSVPPITHAYYGDVDQIDYSDIPEVVVVERTATPDRIRLLRLAGARRVILTFDDNYALMPRYSLASEYWRRNLSTWLEALPLFDLVIVPSQKLVNDFGHRCKQIQLVPNYHDPELWAQPRPTFDHKVLGWGGSMQHLQSWMQSGILPAIRALLKKYPEWKLHLHGYTGVQDLALAGIPFEVFPWQTLDGWATSVRGFDIGLAPLHGDYDARRSNLKVLEYGLAEVPYAATRSVPYLDDSSPGGILVDRPTHWVEILELLMTNPDKRAALAKAGREWAEARTMEKHVDMYEKLLWL